MTEAAGKTSNLAEELPYAADGHVDLEAITRGQLLPLLSNRRWRLENLYFVVDEYGRKQRFKLRWAQAQLLDNLHYWNLILKARQLGFTTFLQLLMLDATLFQANLHAGVIAHTREDAEEFFANKIKFAYDNLPSWLKEARKAPSDSAKKLAFNNGSSIRVGTSLRSGTFGMLHVSEFGKICALYPQKAREIVTGSLNTLHEGSVLFIESTAEGRDGPFYQFCKEAQHRLLRGIQPNKMQFQFHFFPWWRNPTYVLESNSVVITPELRDYFQRLAAKGIKLGRTQQLWYANKAETMQEDMFREFPSTPDEAFHASVIGAYYGAQMTKMRRDKRLGKVPYDPLYPVQTFWDIGMGDHTAIWFHQRVGVENRLIDYLQASGEDLTYYVRRLQEKGYVYGTHYLPHDARHRSPLVGYTYEDYARRLGLQSITVTPRPRNQKEFGEQIEAVRGFLSTASIDEERCSEGIKCLDEYRKDWDENLGCFKNTPLHNWASHGADALRTGAVGYNATVTVFEQDLVPEWAEDF